MLSVIVPVYNVKPYLMHCLESLENQTLEDIEFIIVNDGSTDGSDVICQEFVDSKPKFKLIHKDNGGLMSAWMEGLNYVKGDYIGFVDSDDFIDNRMFEYMYETAKQKKADIIMCDRIDLYENYQVVGRSPIEKGEYTGDRLKIIRSLILPQINKNHITNARWNKIYSKDLFIDNTVYCKSLSRLVEDRFIVPACMFSATKFVYIDKPLYYYRHRYNSNHSMPSKHLYETLKMLYNIQKKMLINKGLYEEYKEYLERANIDYIRMLFQRNMGIKGNLSSKYKTIKQILSDKDYRLVVLKNRHILTTKLGYFLRASFRLNSTIISLLAYEILYFFVNLIKPNVKFKCNKL